MMWFKITMVVVLLGIWWGIGSLNDHLSAIEDNTTSMNKILKGDRS